MRQLVGFLGEAHGVEHLADAFVHRALVFPVRSLEGETEIVFDAAVHQQLEILEDDAEAAPEVWNLLPLETAQIELADAGFPAGERVFAGQRADDGRLPAADPAREIDEFAGKDAQVEPLHDRHLTVGDVGGPENDDGRCIRVHRGQGLMHKFNFF